MPRRTLYEDVRLHISCDEETLVVVQHASRWVYWPLQGIVLLLVLAFCAVVLAGLVSAISRLRTNILQGFGGILIISIFLVTLYIVLHRILYGMFPSSVTLRRHWDGFDYTRSLAGIRRRSRFLREPLRVVIHTDDHNGVFSIDVESTRDGRPSFIVSDAYHLANSTFEALKSSAHAVATPISNWLGAEQVLKVA